MLMIRPLFYNHDIQLQMYKERSNFPPFFFFFLYNRNQRFKISFREKGAHDFDKLDLLVIGRCTEVSPFIFMQLSFGLSTIHRSVDMAVAIFQNLAVDLRSWSLIKNVMDEVNVLSFRWW